LDKKLPECLQLGKLTFSGVYRFVFPKELDGTDRQTPHCYIGEAGGLGERLSAYFVNRGVRMKRHTDGKLKNYGGAQVRGEILNSRGEFSVQSLTIEGCIHVHGAKLNATCLDDPFARRFLENWAILHSRQVEKYYVMNYGIDQGTKEFQRMGRAASRKALAVQESSEKEIIG
jgi:hypothetical protein